MLETHLHKCPYAPIAGLMHKHGTLIEKELRTINILQIKFILGYEVANSCKKEKKEPKKRKNK